MTGFPCSRILVNHDMVQAMPETLFDYSAHRDAGQYTQSGRGTVVMFQYRNHQLVLKTYHRGGVPGRFVRESYFYTGVENTRMWQEFHLLQTLHRMGLPVPRPVAARCVLMTPLTYRGELMMEEIPEARTLVDVICTEQLSEEDWSRIGMLIAEFHHHGVCHGDLNASNILLSKDRRLYLIDFDRSDIRGSKSPNPTSWQSANLKRLKRSLQKCARKLGSLHFTGKSWQDLLDGYSKARQRLGQTALVCLFMDDVLPLLSALL